MYKFRFKNLYDMKDNIRGPLDIISGPETIDPQITSPMGKDYSLLAILMRVEGGTWQLLKNNKGLPLTTGDINVVNTQNAMVIMLYVPVGDGPGGHGVGVFTLAVPSDITFIVTGDDDADVTIESTPLPVVISSVVPAAAWSGGNGVDSFNPAVQNAAQRTITLKDDGQMGGTLTSIISLVDGHNVAPAPHKIDFKYEENNIYIVCYDVDAKQTPNLNKVINDAIYMWVSAGPTVDADGWGIIGNHIVHVPGNNPLSQELVAYNKEIMTQFKGLTSAFQRLNTFSQKHVKELTQVRANIKQATVKGLAVNEVVNEKIIAGKVATKATP